MPQTPRNPQRPPPKPKPNSQPAPQPHSRSPTTTPVTIAPQLQQVLLQIFSNAFSPTSNETALDPPTDSITPPKQLQLQRTIQSVKSALYDRDFASAFDTEEKREAYSLRWSVTRAAAYSAVLREWGHVLLPRSPGRGGGNGEGSEEVGGGERDGKGKAEEENERGESVKVVCLGGGGGAEVVALAAWPAQNPQDESEKRRGKVGARGIDATVVDCMDWAVVTSKLLSSLSTTLPPSSPSHQHRLTAKFTQEDILSLERNEIAALLEGVSLVTICFTLNELYTASMSRATSFLLHLTDVLGSGGVLCVVDSPGSYSGVAMGKRGEGEQKEKEKQKGKEKRYPMAWLLDHTLLKVAVADCIGDRVGAANGDGIGVMARWEKVVEEESRWFRWAKTGLRYEAGLELEDMRFQVHVYRRT